MVSVWMTFSIYNPDFKVTIIRHQITRKWYNIELCLQSNGAISMTVNNRYPRFQRYAIFDAEYLTNGAIYRHSFNEILIGTYTRPTQQCHFE